MPTILVAIILTLGLIQSALAYRAINDNHFTTDSDQTQTRQHLIGYQEKLDDSAHSSKVSARIGSLSVSNSNDSERLSLLRLNSEQDINTGHLSLRLTQAKQIGVSNWHPLLPGATWSQAPAQGWYLELFADRELIDSVTGIQNRLLIDTLGISADYQINKQLTAVGALYKQAISDDNHRNGTVVRLIYTPTEHDWFNIQTRSKFLNGRFNGNGYFSPLSLQEHWLLTTFNRTTKNDKWAMKLKLGLGQQRIDQQPGNNTLLVEFKLRGWQTDHFGIQARAGYTNNGGFSTSTMASRYHYRYVDLSLIGSW